MMRIQVDTNGLFPRFFSERKKNLKRAFGHLCRQYGSLPGYRTCEPSPWKKKIALDENSRLEAAKLQKSLF